MQLTLIETEEAYLVVFDNNPDDWVARFSKHNRFPAQEWAERMAKLYNLRIYTPRGGESGFPPRGGQAHWTPQEHNP